MQDGRNFPYSDIYGAGKNPSGIDIFADRDPRLYETIVVPRKYEFNEHVNDHQVDFCNQVAQRQGNIIVVEDVNKLGDTIEQYGDIIAGMKNGIASNNALFCAEFEKIVDELVK